MRQTKLSLFLWTAVAYGCWLSMPAAGVRAALAPSLQVDYVANEGVLIRSGGKAVLIDGLFREGVSGYERLEPQAREQLETATGPFADIDLILVTHRHADHFDPAAVGRFLEHNDRAILVAPGQVVDILRTAWPGFKQSADRIQAITPESKQSRRLTPQGIDIQVMRLKHGGFPVIENLGFIIQMGGKKILHVGDAEMAAENFSSFRLAGQGIDLFLAPYWFLLYQEGRALIDSQLKTARLIALHIVSTQATDLSRRLSENYPTSILFSNQVGRRSYEVMGIP